MEKTEYYKSFLSVNISFDNEIEKMREYKTLVKRERNKYSKQNFNRKSLTVIPSEISISLELDLKARETELQEFRDQTQNAIVSPLLTEALVKKTEAFIDNIDTTRSSSCLKPLGRFRKAARIVLILCTVSRGWKRYDETITVTPKDGKNHSVQKAGGSQTNRQTKMKFDTSCFVIFQSKLQEDIRDILTMPPTFRSNIEERKVSTLLKKYRFFHLFPEEKQSHICKHIGYERYEHGRIIFFQDRPADRFYFVLSGLISKVKTLNPADGIKKFYYGDLHQGSSTDVNETLYASHRSYTLVCKSNVEVLLLEREDFVQIFHDTDTEQSLRNLLKSIDLFQTYPIDKLIEGLSVKFYAKGVVIEDDITNSQYIYIIRTGCGQVLLQRDFSKKEMTNTENRAFQTQHSRYKSDEKNNEEKPKMRKSESTNSTNGCTLKSAVQIKSLGKGAIYGLESLYPRVFNIVQSATSETILRKGTTNEQKTVLVSSGTECLLINKAIFLNNSDFCTLSKLLALHIQESNEKVESDFSCVSRWNRFKRKVVADVIRKSKKPL